MRFKNLDFGLYRDDGLAVSGRIVPNLLDDIRKGLHQLFANLGLKITVVTGITEVNFLDVTLDLAKENFRPYRKPNDKPLYVNVESNPANRFILRRCFVNIVGNVGKALSCLVA